jgi:chromosomal replication initiator protein
VLLLASTLPMIHRHRTWLRKPNLRPTSLVFGASKKLRIRTRQDVGAPAVDPQLNAVPAAGLDRRSRSDEGVTAIASPNTDPESAAVRAWLREKIGVAACELYFGAPTDVRLSSERLVIAGETQFLLDRIRLNFRDDLIQAARHVAGRDVPVEFELAPHVAHAGAAEPKRAARRRATVKKEGLPVRPDTAGDSATDVALASPPSESQRAAATSSDTASPRTFAEFEFGQANRMVRLAVQQLLQNPGQVSPLYFYGPVGCGKTRLLHELVGAMRCRQRGHRCSYLTATQFLGNFIEALDSRGVPTFRRKCRGLELLAIDDIQCFRGRRTQFAIEELQHTIDALQRQGRQVLLAGDRPLAELDFLGADLVNRLASGLACEVHYIEGAARRNLLQRLAAKRGVRLSDAVVDLVADQLNGDVRQLIGAVNQLHAASLALEGDVDVEQARRVLGDLFAASRRSVSLERIESEVCQTCGVRPQQLKSSRRHQSTTMARMLAIFLARKHTDCPFSEIATYFGQRSHSTAVAARNKVERWVSERHVVRLATDACPAGDAIQRIERRLRVG